MNFFSGSKTFPSLRSSSDSLSSIESYIIFNFFIFLYFSSSTLFKLSSLIFFLIIFSEFLLLTSCLSELFLLSLSVFISVSFLGILTDSLHDLFFSKFTKISVSFWKNS